MIKAIGIVAISAVLLSGCGVAYRNAAAEFISTQPPSAWGSAPPSDYKALQRKILLISLKDPESARFQGEDGQPERVVISASMTDPKVVPVYLTRVQVNAKNSFGGYTGFKEYRFFWNEGRLYAHESESSGRKYLTQ